MSSSKPPSTVIEQKSTSTGLLPCCTSYIVLSSDCPNFECSRFTSSPPPLFLCCCSVTAHHSFLDNETREAAVTPAVASIYLTNLDTSPIRNLSVRKLRCVSSEQIRDFGNISEGFERDWSVNSEKCCGERGWSDCRGPGTLELVEPGRGDSWWRWHLRWWWLETEACFAASSQSRLDLARKMRDVAITVTRIEEAVSRMNKKATR